MVKDLYPMAEARNQSRRPLRCNIRGLCWHGVWRALSL